MEIEYLCTMKLLLIQCVRAMLLFFIPDAWEGTDVILCIFAYMAVNFKICKTLHCLLMLYKQSWKKDTLYIYSVSLRNELCKGLKSYHAIVRFIFVLPFLFLRGTNEIIIMVMVLICVLVLMLLSYPDRNCLLKANDLHIGYGAALAYYKNYLKLNMPENFKKRVEQFKSYHKVHVPTKLYILVPKTCKIPRYLDNDKKTIERCQELPTAELTQGGIKNRKYNVTVYLVKTMNGQRLRMAVEYAPPLKGLFALKEKKIITEKEMFNQRKLFAETLKDFLKDGDDLYQFCEIIEYDDERSEVSEILENYYRSRVK